MNFPLITKKIHYREINKYVDQCREYQKTINEQERTIYELEDKLNTIINLNVEQGDSIMKLTRSRDKAYLLSFCLTLALIACIIIVGGLLA